MPVPIRRATRKENISLALGNGQPIASLHMAPPRHCPLECLLARTWPPVAEVAMVTRANVSVGSQANRPETWVDIIRDRAQHRPEQVVYTFLVDGHAQESRLTFGELDQRARAIAASLQRRLSPGDR